MKKVWVKISLIMIMVLLVAGCAKEEESTNSYDRSESKSKEAMYEMESGTTSVTMETTTEAYKDSAEEPARSFGGNSGLNNQAQEALKNRKIIKTGDVYMETLEFDQTLKDIKAVIDLYGAYTSNSNIEGGSRMEKYRHRQAFYTIKVPAQNFEMMFADVQGIGHVLNASDNMSDVTSQITDIEARLKTLRIQEARLLDILEKLENLEDIVELEYALQDVRYEIESFEASLRNLEDQVSFSTISLRVQEVYEQTVVEERPPLTLKERISEGMNDTFADIKEGAEDLLVFVIVEFPYILFWGLVISITIVMIRKKSRNYMEDGKVKKETTNPEGKGKTSENEAKASEEEDNSSK